jgi:hypothetical protein
MYKVGVNMAEGGNCRKSAGGMLERGIIKHLPETRELAVTGLQTDTQYMSSTLSILFYLVFPTAE